MIRKTKVIKNPQAQEKIHEGVNVLADVVEVSLSPMGRNVGIAHPTTTGEVFLRESLHDGVKIAHSVDIKDEMVNFAVQVLKEAAQKQVDTVGDGTTAVISLARAIYNECYTMVAAGVKPMLLRTQLKDGLAILLNEIEKQTKQVSKPEELEQIATISSEDEVLGKLIADMFAKIGKDGVVTIEDSHQEETTIEYQEGMQFDKGWQLDFFITDPERMEATHENAYFLITDKSLFSLEDLAKLLGDVKSRGGALVIISPSVTGEALLLLAKNKLEGKLPILVIQAPGMGQVQKSMLQDIAILTGASFIAEDAGAEFKDVKISDLGRAAYICSTKNATIISGGKGRKTAIQARITSIQEQLKTEESEYDRAKLKERLAKLTNGVAVIKAGGGTEIEMKEQKERIDDAVCATRAAMKHGIVIGGEIVYLKIRDALSNSVAHQILYRALERPFAKLVENSGENAGKLLAELEHQKPSFGFDVMSGEWKDFLKAGIVDPAQVSTEALKNAISVVTILIITEALVIPDMEEVKK